jgi:hypothetical protein
LLCEIQCGRIDSLRPEKDLSEPQSTSINTAKLTIFFGKESSEPWKHFFPPFVCKSLAVKGWTSQYVSIKHFSRVLQKVKASESQTRDASPFCAFFRRSRARAQMYSNVFDKDL